MRYGKTRILLAVFLMFSLALSGCTREELRFIGALEKMSNAKSYEYTGRVSFEMDFSAADEDDAETLQKVKYILDGMGFDMVTVYQGDAKNGKLTAFVNGEFFLDPIKMDMDMWLDMDLKADEPKYQVVLRNPALFKAVLPEEYGKEYLDIDYFKLSALTGGDAYGAGLAESLYASLSMRNRFYGMADVFKQMELSGSHVKSSLTDEGLTKLTLTMTDAQLKEFIPAFLVMVKGDDVLPDELPDMYGPFLENTSILGDKGLVYELVLDNDGFIQNETLALNLRLDSGIMPYGYYNYGGYTEFTVTVDGKYSNINGENPVNFPELTADNTADVAGLMKKQLAEEAEALKYSFPYGYYSTLRELDETPREFPLKGTFDGNEVNRTVKLNKADDYGYRYCMPLRQAAEIFEGEISWDAESGIAGWTVDGMDMLVYTAEYSEDVYDYAGDLEYPYDYPDDAYYIDDFEAYMYYVPGYISENTVYIPIYEIEDFLGVDFGYNEATGTLLLK